MNDRQCIVAVGAHAADMELAAGGALAVHARAGWDVHLIHLTLGEKGNPGMTPAAYGEQKRGEADAAAALLGAVPHFLSHADGEVPACDDAAAELARLLRSLRPQVLVAHWPGSMHLDHTNAHWLTLRAHFMAAIRHFDLDGLPPMPACRIYYSDNWEDDDAFEPYIYVDVSEVMDSWERAAKAFAIGRGEGGFPYWDWYQARTRLHGIMRRVRHAQAFAIEARDRYQVRTLL